MTDTVATDARPDAAAYQQRRAARWAVLVIFFINGALFANWVSRIPTVQGNLGLNKGELGLVLVGMSVGVLTALSLAGGLIARFGSHRVTLIGALLMSAMLAVLGFMPSAVMLWGALFLFGAFTSTMDVAMNSQGVEVERGLGKSVMSSFHAAFSIGGFAGAAIGSFMVAQGVSVQVHFMLMAGFFAVMAVFAARYLLNIAHEGESSNATFQLPPRVLWPLGAVVLCAAIAEGAMADWSGIYLETVVGTEAALAAWGFASFSLMMTLGRASGDWLVARFDRAVLVRLGGGLAFSGLMLAILVPSLVTALIGFSAVGIGLSITIPLVFSVAGNLPNIPSGAGIAGVATIGYAGFLAGPPLIGVVSEATSLQLGLGIVAVLAGSLVITGHTLKKHA
jgi:MFS family permease